MLEKPYYFYMRTKIATTLAFLLLQYFMITPSEAAIKLTVQYVVQFTYGEYADGVDATSSCLVGSKCASDNRKLAAAILKKASTKTAFNLGCKKQDESYLGSRIKVTSATGATAGLGNLTSVVATNIRWDVDTANTEDWDSEEEYPYEYEEDDPTYIEEGYEYVYFTADCTYSGTVTLTKSNAYTIYIDGGRGPEYSYAELVKKKWKVVLSDN
jgi:hypothetical protein